MLVLAFTYSLQYNDISKLWNATSSAERLVLIMTKTKKEQWIAAHEKVLLTHETGDWKGTQDTCALCACANYICRNCTLWMHSYHKVWYPCCRMKTYPYYGYTTEERIEFHEKAIRILEELPEERFKLGYKKHKINFPELWELDRLIWKNKQERKEHNDKNGLD